MNNKRIVFMGTPPIALKILQDLQLNNYHIVLVVAQPSRKKDRKGNIIDPPTVSWAKENHLDYLQLQNIKDEYSQILQYQPDIIITCAYGQIIPLELINYPKYGCINVHGSLLPSLRGGAPIQHAIIDGLDKTGVTIMYMDKGMDDGDIITASEIVIEDSDNSDSLFNKIALEGSKLLLDTLPKIFNKTNNRIKQDSSLVTYGLNITKEEEKINFSNPARKIFNQIRGLSSIPGAYCYLDNRRLKIYSSAILKSSSLKPGVIVKVDDDGLIVGTNDNDLKILDIQLEGKKRCLVKEYLHGINRDFLVGKELK